MADKVDIAVFDATIFTGRPTTGHLAAFSQRISFTLDLDQFNIIATLVTFEQTKVGAGVSIRMTITRTQEAQLLAEEVAKARVMNHSLLKGDSYQIIGARLPSPSMTKETALIDLINEDSEGLKECLLHFEGAGELCDK
ncbi:hypothetical protein BKA70DRAFT_1220959 [Coprinopsis sp. MPI-PUGE-AT-0042]|nr:hypothetical protein BKA70DRAFT_1220959 [Coprinopsis sp. MPI-PUGE-AT-0042]